MFNEKMKRAMKKLIVLAAAAVAFSNFTASADNDRMITTDKLPANSAQFIKEHFADRKVAYAKEERDFLEIQYEVMFSDGSKVEFSKDGEWKEVDCRYGSVPAAIVPERIAAHVAGSYPGVAILAIDRDRRDYEVKLANGLELTFDLRFNLIDIDD